MATLNYFGRYMGIKGFETQQRARKVGEGWGGEGWFGNEPQYMGYIGMCHCEGYGFQAT